MSLQRTGDIKHVAHQLVAVQVGGSPFRVVHQLGNEALGMQVLVVHLI